MKGKHFTRKQASGFYMKASRSEIIRSYIDRRHNVPGEIIMVTIGACASRPREALLSGGCLWLPGSAAAKPSGGLRVIVNISRLPLALTRPSESGRSIKSAALSKHDKKIEVAADSLKVKACGCPEVAEPFHGVSLCH